MTKSFYKAGAVIAFSLVIMPAFQNCSNQTSFSKMEQSSNSAASIPETESTPLFCNFNGSLLSDNQSVKAYQNSSVAFGNLCVSEERRCLKGELSGSFSYSSCEVGAPASCMFSGNELVHGQTIIAYASSTVPFGEKCQEQSRTCSNGALSGTYLYSSCKVEAEAACVFNGAQINPGLSVTAYLNSSVPYGQTCQSEKRVCSNGMLSGSYQYNTCSVGAPNSCMFNGQQVAHGANVVAYKSSSAAYGSKCETENRTCDNGVLSGSFQYGSCAVDSPKSCLFNGVTYPHGTSVTAFFSSTVPFTSDCVNVAETRICNNGDLSGSAPYASCAKDQPNNCQFNNQPVLHGSSTTAYSSADVPYGSSCSSETRSCYNGSLSGSYQFASCTVKPPASCTFNGQTYEHGSSVTAYFSSTVSFGSDCASVAESRTCNNGVLSGSAAFASCSPDAPKACVLNDITIPHGSYTTAYSSSSVQFGATCTSENRQCNNGVLSGSYQYTSCAPQAPSSCTFNGNTYAHGESVVAYSSATVPFSSDCANVAETRTCNNGSLSGSAAFASCTKDQPRACLFNGLTIAHGQLVVAAKESETLGVACQYEDRVCYDSVLSGSYQYNSCVEKNVDEFTVSFEKAEQPLDMIWVIDNSSSMSVEAAQVRNNLNSFLTELNNKSNFKFALISAKGTSGTSVSIPTTFNTSNFVQINLSIGSHDGPQKLIDQLKSSSVLQGFFRANSKKVIVFVTDDNASGVGTASTYLNNLLIQQNWSKESVSQFGFVAPSDRTCSTKAADGVFYEQLASLTNGSIYNLCDSDWKPNFNSLLQTSISKASRLFTLSKSGINKILSVTVAGKLLNNSDYSFDGKSISISESVLLNEGDKVIVNYEM